jgi:DNA-binding NtrC family response regulator
VAHVLIVDDEKCIRLTLTAFIKASGHTATAVEDGAEALRVLREEAVDVVITDLIMPGISGTELLRQIKEKTPQIQVILMTGEPDLESADDALRCHAFDYLAKPMTKDTILDAIQRAIAAKPQEDNHAESRNAEPGTQKGDA